MSGNAAPPSADDADKLAAHAFLSELNTRIATQPLPYQDGDEATALKSLRDIFDFARAAIKDHPGCKGFTAAVTRMLNEELRPVTAKWHRALIQGLLDSRDGADEFRGDLARVQGKLRDFASQLQLMAYGETLPGPVVPAVMPPDELKSLLGDVGFGLGKTPGIPPDTVEAINRAEAGEVTARRTLRGSIGTERRNAAGLALSGGGIRSATFCLGVVQVLTARGLLKDIDFLSTVSGGGYTGSFLTARLGGGEAYDGVAGPFGPDPNPIRYLRSHAKYLSAVDLKDSWSMVTATVAGMVLNWSAPVLLVVLAALLAEGLSVSLEARWWRPGLAVSGILTAVALVAYGWLMRKGPVTTRRGGDVLGALTAISVALAAGWLLGVGHDVLLKWIASHWRTGIGIGSLAVVGPAILRFVPVLKTPWVRKLVLQALLWLAGLVVPLGAVGLFYAFWFLADQNAMPSASAWNPLSYCGGTAILILMGIVLAAIAIAVLNINLTAPHRLYRDRLAATFIQKSDTDDAATPLADINPQKTAPYHLINAALNLPSSTTPALRDRRCDFFLFSRHWCGSPVVGYRPTAEWKTNGEPADLATAMAVSGAAVSSYMGLGAMPSLTALLTFLNVRLGFWIRNPVKRKGLPAPGFLCLVREMFGSGMSEHQAWLNLSDGGHIENMAVYELLRRRCKFIICVDGEADPDYSFQGLMTLARHAQIDFGVRIDASLGDLKPDPQTHFSRVHAVFSRIHYPDEGGDRPAATGLLLYLKLSVTGNEPELIKRYRLTHPEFPHQTTLDQFFDEEQFEAYRQLGVHAADGLFSPALMASDTAPTTVASWFKHLAASLLRPEAAIAKPATP